MSRTLAPCASLVVVAAFAVGFQAAEPESSALSPKAQPGLTVGSQATEPHEVKTDNFSAALAAQGLTSLRDAQGVEFASGSLSGEGMGIYLVDADYWATDTEPVAKSPASRRYVGFEGLPGAAITCWCEADPSSGDLLLIQHAQTSRPGVWGVQWTIGNIPLDMNILVPGLSGIRLSRTSPRTSFEFDYPVTWEAQLVVVEGQGRGFYVWAEDAQGLFKRLTVTRTTAGWRLGFTTMNFAPFEGHTSCDSARWRLNVYTGDWRVPARRYREWAEQNFRPTPLAQQKPDWVKDVRCCVITDMDVPTIEALAARLDPGQTLLYVPGWRKPGYDRDYPAYDAADERMAPFIERAHELGYRVMLHVNYFGVDPLNPLYAQFEPCQVRSPWGGHEKEWWLWERAEPPIKFAYINPAYKPWRDLFVERMTQLCSTYAVDALHLDQTLCIYNDHNGLIDGLSMVQGNVLLHEALRDALPGVALSGEGLNEVTYRHEAFAQRHVWGINHAEGTWDPSCVAMAHPIAAYLLGPYTRMCGYLGCAPPDSGQLYAAWQTAYAHWGVIPTLKPTSAQIAEPAGFGRQFFDEAAFWFKQKPEPEWDGPWPPNVVFPFRTGDGTHASRMADGRLLWKQREISRTITGVTEARLPGSISRWPAYDQERLFGLDPGQYYPCFQDTRDLDVFHIERLPEAMVPTLLVCREGMAVVRTRRAGGPFADLCRMAADAEYTSEPFEGTPTPVTDPWNGADGAQFYPEGKVLCAHPPWKGAGSGATRARFRLHLPAGGALRFAADVAMAPEAAQPGRTDGVTFGVAARAGQNTIRSETHNATSTRQAIILDLTPFAGAQVTLDLTVHPGPGKDPSYDWARWYEPRVESAAGTEGELIVVGPGDWPLALSGVDPLPVQRAANRYSVRAEFPGAVYFLRDEPEPATLPCNVAETPFTATFADHQGLADAPPYATAVRQTGTVGGVTRSGLFTHPPDRGSTIVDVPMTLPGAPAEFRAYVGIRDGSMSQGVVFIVEANGVELAREDVLPGAWYKLSCDLAPWAGKPVVLSLITDADGSYDCDWAQWGEPVLLPAGSGPR